MHFAIIIKVCVYFTKYATTSKHMCLLYRVCSFVKYTSTNYTPGIQCNVTNETSQIAGKAYEDYNYAVVIIVH